MRFRKIKIFIVMKQLILTEAQLNYLRVFLSEGIEMSRLTDKLNYRYDDVFYKVKQHPDFEIIDGDKVEIDTHACYTNRCENNVYFRVKGDRAGKYWGQVPVAGYIIFKSNLTILEHFWIYCKRIDGYVEITPNIDPKEYYYLGLKSSAAYEQIQKSKTIKKVGFLKEGNFYSKYCK